MKTYTFEEAKDKYLGKKGTEERDAYENELRLDLIGEAKMSFNIEFLNQKVDLASK